MSKDNDFPRLLEKQDLTTSRLRIDLAAEQYKDHHLVPLSSETSSSSGTYFPFSFSLSLSLEYLSSLRNVFTS